MLYFIYKLMTSKFTTNYVFEENLEAVFNIIDGIFNTNGQHYILQHLPAIQNLSSLNKWSDNITPEENVNNYFEKTYRYSTDSTNWSNWLPLQNGEFVGFNNTNINNLIWIQIRYLFKQTGTDPIDLDLTEFKFTGTRLIDEIFEPAVLLPGEPVVYTNQDTYKVFGLNGFNVYLQDQSQINNLDIKFRFTQTQGRRWSDWINLTSDNLKELRLEKIKFTNFQFSFHNLGNSNIQLYDLELLGDFQNVTANYKTTAKFGLKSQCNPLAVEPSPTDCIENDDKSCLPLSEAITPWNSDIDNCTVCGDNKYLNLNDKKLMGSLINLNAQLNDFVNSVNSWKVTYLLTDPDGKGIDHILHEQQIHNVISMKDINIIVPDNQFPTDNISFNGFDLDLIQTFEVHIIKDQFKKTFGVEFRPSMRDVLYFCDLNQLWEVEQQFPARSFMNAEIYYRVILKKYNTKPSRDFANTQDGQNAKMFIDNLTKHTTLDSMFFADINDDIKKVTKDKDVNINNPSQQNTPSTNSDVRFKIHDRVEIIDEVIYNATLKFITSYYKMPIKSKNMKLIEYNNVDQTVNTGQNRAISMWFRTGDYDPTYDFTLLSNYDYTNNQGYKLSLYQGSLDFSWNNNTYSLPVANKLMENIWYSFLINFNNVKEKCEIAIYKRQNENGVLLNDSKLVLVQKNTFNINSEPFEHKENIFIGGTDTFNHLGNNKSWNITNIRIYNEIVNSRHVVLNENIVSDAHLTELVDNARPPIKLPNFGNL